MAALLLALAIVMIPIWLSPDPVDPQVPPALAVPQRPAGKTDFHSQVPSANFKTHKLAPFNRSAFLASFERQAGQSLVTCLKGSVGEKGSIELIGRMSISGRLTGVRAINLPPGQVACALAAIDKMNFPSGLSPDPSSAEGIEIEWRFDW